MVGKPVGLCQGSLGDFQRELAAIRANSGRSLGAKRAPPKGHWPTGLFLQLQGQTLTKPKRYYEAEPALLETHRMLAAALGEDHPTTLDTVNTLAEHYQAHGKLEEAQR